MPKVRAIVLSAVTMPKYEQTDQKGEIESELECSGA
jgi:hypothetical protein